MPGRYNSVTVTSGGLGLQGFATTWGLIFFLFDKETYLADFKRSGFYISLLEI